MANPWGPDIDHEGNFPYATAWETTFILVGLGLYHLI